MFFQWPQYLWLLLALPLLPAAYLWLLRRRGKVAVRISSLHRAQAAVAGRQWRRHVPPVLLLVALLFALLAAARPVASVSLPWARSTVMLAIDVSLSMRVSDVKPNRMVAAQDAAKVFLRDLPRQIEVGLVTFAGSSQVAQAATLDRDVLVAAIDGFQMQRGTAIGSAIVLALAELFPDHGIQLSDLAPGSKPQGRSLDDKARPPPKEITPVPPASYTSAAIILLSDGRRTTGVDTLTPVELADHSLQRSDPRKAMAADRGVRVDVVGLGTVDGESSFGEGLAIYLKLDEPTLREVARITGGQYHHAGTAEKLREVYQNLGTRLQVHKRETEVTALMALAAALLAIAAGVLSMLWFGRMG